MTVDPDAYCAATVAGARGRRRRFCAAPSVAPGAPCHHHTLEALACLALNLPPWGLHLVADVARAWPPLATVGQLALFA